jgi:hypothetical protein
MASQKVMADPAGRNTSVEVKITCGSSDLLAKMMSTNAVIT